MNKPRTCQAGFTLAEVLVTLFIFSLISVGTMAALTTSLSGKAQIDARLEHVRKIELARSIIKSDIANIRLRPARDSLGTPEAYVLQSGGASLLTFTRGGRPNPGGLEARGDLERVSYIFEDGTLFRTALAHENPAPGTQVLRRELLSGLSRANVGFQIENYTQSQIFIAEGDASALPKLIRLDLEFEGGDRLSQYFELDL